MKIVLPVCLAIAVACSIWLYIAWQKGARTKSWYPAKAEVLKVFENNSAEVYYRANDGVSRISVISDVYYPDLQKEIYVFVNSGDAEEAVMYRGHSASRLTPPMIVGGAAVLFSLVMILIKFSPSED